MGLFDVQGHTSSRPSFQFGSPLFERISIRLDPKYYQGKQLVILTENQSDSNPYIQSVTWNGKPVKNNWIYRDILMKGGTLTFVMGPEPNKAWGLGTVPPSMSNEK